MHLPTVSTKETAKAAQRPALAVPPGKASRTSSSTEAPPRAAATAAPMPGHAAAGDQGVAASLNGTDRKFDRMSESMARGLRKALACRPAGLQSQVALVSI
jgi:hypothetical protein